MADDRYHPEYRQQSQDDRYAQQHYQAAPQQAHYPPPPGDNSQRPPEDTRASMAASVSLPSMHDPRASGYGPPSHGQPHPYPTDPRYASPGTTNGYPPPHGQQAPGYLPPLQSQPDPRSAGYRPPEQYGAARPPPPPYGQDLQYQQPQQQHHDPYYYRQPPPGAPGPHNPYPYAPQGAYPPEFGQPQGGPQMAQAAPRQRTSIACKYCRKRKIRCSGYQSAPGGKCQNCARMNQECVFQPVSSSSSTAFIPVSAVPGGVPPGTPLYGAYGQPLAPQVHPYGPGGGQQPPPPPPQQQQQQQQHQPHQQPPPHAPYYAPPPHGGPPHHAGPGHQPPQGPHAQHGPPTQSPAESSYSYTSARGDETSQSGRRRRRSSEDQEEGYRLPPPRVGATEDEPRRRSPAEFSSRSSPGGMGLPPFSRQSPRNPAMTQASSHAQNQTAPDGRSPVAPNASSGGSTPAQHNHAAGQHPQQQSYPQTPQPQGQQPQQQQQQQSAQTQQQQQGQQGQQGQGSSVMSLSNLMGTNNNIDRGMINRLNKSKDNNASK